VAWKALGSPVLYLVACVACLGTGVYLGRPVEAAVKQGDPGKGAKAAREGAVGFTGGDDAAVKEDAPDRKRVLQRSIAACETEALWEWLATLPRGQELEKSLVENELIDRLGWGAWEHVRGLEAGKRKDLVGESILHRLSERDPWKAYEEWQQHRGEFEHPMWGRAVIAQCTMAAAGMSAEQLLKVFGSITKEEAEELMMVEYAQDFDFRTVLDHLVAGGPHPYTMSEDLLPSWAERAPEEAAVWLASHPEYLDHDYQRSDAAESLAKIAGMKMSEEVRAQVLGDLKSMPPDFLDRTWRNISSNAEGKVSAEVLSSADLMDRREIYLEGVLMETRALETLDDSWQAVPLEERRDLLDKVEQKWAAQAPTPVEAKARRNWREMVEREWGMR